MRKFLALFVFFIGSCLFANEAGLFQYPDVSSNHIVFTYGGSIWLVEKTGGTAVQLTNARGMERYAKFSPDGKEIAFTGNYHGNSDVYIMSVDGGIPERLTFHGMSERVVDWAPRGSEILYNSKQTSGRQRFGQFFEVSKNGGLSERLAMPYGEFASYSPEGDKIAYTLKSRVFRTWKRYRGGTAADIWIFNLKDSSAERITSNEANDEIPMWIGNHIYFLSDRGENKRANIWKYNIESKEFKQVTVFKDVDVRFPGYDQEQIVFLAGEKMYLLNCATGQYNEVKVSTPWDEITFLPELKNLNTLIMNTNISPKGNRVIMEARGEVFSLPAKDGITYCLTNTSGVAERYPAVSPDGKTIAYWSDESGEYQMVLHDLASGKKKSVTNYKDGYRYSLYWSPDSKKIAYIDHAMTIQVFSVKDSKIDTVDQGLWMFQGALDNFKVSWSSDSRWLAYSRGTDNRSSAVFIYDFQLKKKHQVTSGFYSCQNPVFDCKGEYLFFSTNRTLNPLYSDLDRTFIYPNSTTLAFVTLKKDGKNLLGEKNDVIEADEKEDEKKDKKKDGDKKDKKEKVKVTIDFKDIEYRVVLIPVKAGNIGKLAAADGKLFYLRYANSGSAKNDPELCYYDFKDKKEESVIKGIWSFQFSFDKKKILVEKKRQYAIISPAKGQKMDDKVNTGDMTAEVDRKEEWKQIFRDAWRLQRDLFYDEDMHGVDWQGVYDKYSAMLDKARHREDLNFLLGEMIGELNASHTYKGGGDQEYGKRLNVGYLGVDWGVKDGAYYVKRIVRGAPWDSEVRSPFDLPGSSVKEGDFILAVNGRPLDVKYDPYYYFQGLGGKTIELTVSKTPKTQGAKKTLVKALKSETRLRHLEWIENNRKWVEKHSDGEIGYVYVRSTGIDGQNELSRQFYGQYTKDALIIDERFNSGGQIPDRFIELLDRKPLAFWDVRDGKNWKHPTFAHYGPKAMLINGWSGSGGDAFPDYFKKAGLGPLIGTRTWGGLIGITGAPTLIDGGFLTVPTFRMYHPDGRWFEEGHGVDPDIEVIDDPSILVKGIDPQLKKAVEVLLDSLKTYKGPVQTPPAKEVR